MGQTFVWLLLLIFLIASVVWIKTRESKLLLTPKQIRLAPYIKSETLTKKERDGLESTASLYYEEENDEEDQETG